METMSFKILVICVLLARSFEAKSVGSIDDRMQQLETMLEKEHLARIELEQKLANAERRIGSRQLTEDPEIAFFASLSTNIEHIGGGQIIVFDNVVTKVDSTNSLGGYNHVTGVFTAPVDGLYVFSTTLMAHEFASAHYMIYRDNTRVATLAVAGELHTYYSAAATIVLTLAKGETVCVRHQESVDGALAGAFLWSGRSMFSGFLLQPHNRVVTFIG